MSSPTPELIPTFSGDDDFLIRTIHGLKDAELRLVLQHLALVQPESVYSALRHLQKSQQETDICSIDTELISNKRDPPPTKRTTDGGNEQPPAINSSRGPSRRIHDGDDTVIAAPGRNRLQAPRGQQQQSQQHRQQQYQQQQRSRTSAMQRAAATSMKNTRTCYLVYDADSVGELFMTVQSTQSTKSAALPRHALAKFVTTKWKDSNHESASVTSNKMNPKHVSKGNSTRRLLLSTNCGAGGKVGRKQFYLGYCNFFLEAKRLEGQCLQLLRSAPMLVDVHMYQSNGTTQMLLPTDSDTPSLSLRNTLAVCCLPKDTSFYGSTQVELRKWFAGALTVGAAIKL